MVRETALTTETAVTVHYVLVNDGSEDVVVRLAEVSPRCCVAAQERGPLVVPARGKKPYGLRVRLPAQAGIVAGKCRFVVATRGRGLRITPKSLHGRFEVSVLESLELVSGGGDPKLLAGGPCGEIVPVEAQLCVRASKGEQVGENDAAYDLVLMGATGDLKVEDFLGRRDVGGRVVEYRWRVRGTVQLPSVPGTSPPVDLLVRAGGKELGRTWFVLSANSRYRVEPPSVILKCKGLCEDHRFKAVVRGEDDGAVRVAKVVCTGPVDASAEEGEGGEYVVRGVFECGENAPSYAEIELHLDSEKQRIVRIPVLHLRPKSKSSVVGQERIRSAR